MSNRTQEAPPLKVLMINTVPMRYEGITMVMLNYARNMDRDGLQLDFLANNDVESSIRRELADMGCGLHVLRNRNRRPLRYVLRLARLIRQNGYEVVHAHGNSCTLAAEMLAARLGGAKVRCAHSHNTKCSSPRLNRWLRPFFERLCTHGFACGTAAGQWLFGERPFVVLNNGTDGKRYGFDAAARTAFREALGIGGRTAIGHVANFNPQKNHAFLIDVFEEVHRRDPDPVLVLVGDGSCRGEIGERVRQKGLEDSVIFTGTSREIPQILSAMDFMVLPSLFEGLPNVLIEWQASGLRSLVADTVTPECRLTDLVEFLPLKPQAWVEAILGMRVRAEDREADSERAARQIAAAGYDIRENAARLRRLYFEYAGRPLPGLEGKDKEIGAKTGG